MVSFTPSRNKITGTRVPKPRKYKPGVVVNMAACHGDDEAFLVVDRACEGSSNSEKEGKKRAVESHFCDKRKPGS